MFTYFISISSFAEETFTYNVTDWSGKTVSVSNQSFGEELAKKVAAVLMSKKFSYNHAEYCGSGFFVNDGIISYVDEVFDGKPYSKSSLKFDSTDKFIKWLALQSDYSLSNCRDGDTSFTCMNQTVTKKRLNEFIR